MKGKYTLAIRNDGEDQQQFEAFDDEYDMISRLAQLRKTHIILQQHELISVVVTPKGEVNK